MSRASLHSLPQLPQAVLAGAVQGRACFQLSARTFPPPARAGEGKGLVPHRWLKLPRPALDPFLMHRYKTPT